MLVGNICRDIEVKYFNDRKIVKNTIAVRRDFKNKNGEYDSDFFTFTTWGNHAEYLQNYAHKGDRVAIVGKLLNNNYEKDGQTIYSNDIQVENIEIIMTRGNQKEMTDEEVNQKLEDIGVDVQFLD